MVAVHHREVNYFIVIILFTLFTIGKAMISHKNRAKPELTVTPVSPAGAWASCPRLPLAVRGVDTRQPLHPDILVAP